MKGLKIRVQPGPIFSATYRELGANPIAIDFSEIYLALSQTHHRGDRNADHFAAGRQAL